MRWLWRVWSRVWRRRATTPAVPQARGGQGWRRRRTLARPVGIVRLRPLRLSHTARLARRAVRPRLVAPAGAPRMVGQIAVAQGARFGGQSATVDVPTVAPVSAAPSWLPLAVPHRSGDPWPALVLDPRRGMWLRILAVLACATVPVAGFAADVVWIDRCAVPLAAAGVPVWALTWLGSALVVGGALAVILHRVGQVGLAWAGVAAFVAWKLLALARDGMAWWNCPGALQAPAAALVPVSATTAALYVAFVSLAFAAAWAPRDLGPRVATAPVRRV